MSKKLTTITASKFKEHCLAILDDVSAEGLIITKRGTPVAKLFPVKTHPSSLIGALKGKVKINGDIFSTGIKWNAQS